MKFLKEELSEYTKDKLDNWRANVKSEVDNIFNLIEEALRNNEINDMTIDSLLFLSGDLKAKLSTIIKHTLR